MPSSNLQLIAEFRAKPDKTEEVERRIVDFVKRVRAEEGCELAFFYRVNEDSDRFVFLAEFAGDGALQDHLNAEWRQGMVAEIPELLAEAPRRFTMRRVA